MGGGASLAGWALTAAVSAMLAISQVRGLDKRFQLISPSDLALPLRSQQGRVAEASAPVCTYAYCSGQNRCSERWRANQ